MKRILKKFEMDVELIKMSNNFPHKLQWLHFIIIILD